MQSILQGGMHIPAHEFMMDNKSNAEALNSNTQIFT